MIIGWGRQTAEKIGPVHRRYCSNCSTERTCMLYRTSYWVSLYLLPTIPYEIRYFLVCPICTESMELNKVAFYELKSLAELTDLLESGKIAEEEFERRLKRTLLPSHQFFNKLSPIFWQAPLGLSVGLLLFYLFNLSARTLP
jgi:hypothetical protein